MKTKRCDWLLKITRVNEQSIRFVSYVNLINLTREEALGAANKYASGNTFVRLYKFNLLIQ